MNLQISDLQINDWPIKRLSLLVFSILIAYIFVSFLETINLDLSSFKAIFGFIILLIPGFIILRIFNLHELGVVKSITFSLGLSLSTIMIVGLVLNQLFPLIGISKPFTQSIVQLTFIFLVLFLLLINYIVDNEYKPRTHKINFSIMNPYLLLIILNLFIGIIGVYCAYYFDNNLLVMIFILIMSFIPFFIVLNKIDDEFYPFVIFITTLALLYHVSLFSPFLVGTDIFGEFWQANLTYVNQIWNVSSTGLLNSVLSITLIPPIFSIMCGFNNLLYLKIIAPFFFSFVPVILYSIYEKALDLTEKEKFLAVFFVIAISQFYSVMIGLARQELAELFFVLLLWLILDKKYTAITVSVFIIFTFALVCSHYALSYIFLFYILSLSFFGYILPKTRLKARIDVISSKINLNYILLLAVLIIAWQIYVSYGSVLGFLVGFIETVINGFSDLFAPQTNFSVQVISSVSVTIYHTIYRYIFYFTMICILIGIIDLFWSIKNKKELTTFDILAITSCTLLGIFIVLPFAGFQLGFERIFHLTSFILAPYMLLGFKRFLSLIKMCLSRFTKFKINNNQITINKFLALFLTIFFLFNAGFIYEITNDELPNSVSLSFHHAKDPTKIDKTRGVMYLKVQTVLPSELSAAEWFSEHRDQNKKIYTTYGSTGLSIYGLRNATNVDINKFTSGRYIGYFYLNSIAKIMNFDIMKKRTSVSETRIPQESIDNLTNYNKIYSSTGDDIFLIS